MNPSVVILALAIGGSVGGYLFGAIGIVYFGLDKEVYIPSVVICFGGLIASACYACHADKTEPQVKEGKQ